MGKLRIKQIHMFATEVASAINADLDGAGVTAAIAAEATRATTAEGVNAGLVSTEKSRALLAEGVLSDAIDGLGDEYATDVELTEAVSVETARATTAEGALSDRVGANEDFIATIDETYATDTQLSDAVSVEANRALLAEGVNAGLVSTEKSRALLAEGVLSDAIDGLDSVYATDVELTAAVSVEKSRAIAAEELIDGRVTTLLAGKTEALDTFGEIRTFIEDLSTEDITTIAAISTAVSNDVVHAGLIDDNADAISTEKSRALLAEGVLSDAIDGLGDEYATDVELSEAVSVEKSRAIAAEGTLSGRVDANEEFIATIDETYATDAQLSNAVSVETARATGVEGTLSTAIDALDASIDGFGFVSIEQFAFEVAAEGFKAKTAVQVGAEDELDIFVNGLQVHRADQSGDELARAAAEGWVSANGIDFTVQALGYDLDANDHIIISGKVA